MFDRKRGEHLRVKLKMDTHHDLKLWSLSASKLRVWSPSRQSYRLAWTAVKLADVFAKIFSPPMPTFET